MKNIEGEIKKIKKAGKKEEKKSAQGGSPPTRSDARYGLRIEASERTGTLGGEKTSPAISKQTKKVKKAEKTEKTEIVEKKKKKLGLKRALSFGTISKKDILYFTKNLSILLHAGSTLPESLTVLAGQTKGRLNRILTETAELVNAGQKFSDSLALYPRVFSPFYTNMLQMGEESGALDENLKQLAVQLEKNHELKKKVLNALFYPSIVFFGGLILSGAVSFFILPKVSKLFRNFKIELPWTTRALLNASDFLQNHGFVVAIALLITIPSIIWFLKRPFLYPVTHWIILHLPIVKTISMNFNLTLMCRSLGALLDSGLTIDEGIQMSKKNMPNFYYRKFLENAYESIKGGGTFTDILKENGSLFSPTDIQIINVGERSGSLSDSLRYCSEIHEQEVDSITKSLATVLEPLLLITIGLLIGFLALSIITPIYSITGQFQR